jgi:hypothetical protein
VLAGGADVGVGDYIERLKKRAEDYPIEILKSPSFDTLKSLYGEAKLKEKILEFTDTRGDHHVLYLCDYISGTPQLHKDSVEANNKDSQQSYRPEWVPINLIDNLTIYPKEEKEFLVNYLK